MKCILIISSIPDIIFIHADKAFIKHINKVSLKAGFIGEDHDEDEMDMTALCQIFSPMITSLTYMNDLGNPYSSILCEDGTLFVFSQVCILSSFVNSVLFCVMVGGEGGTGENTSIYSWGCKHGAWVRALTSHLHVHVHVYVTWVQILDPVSCILCPPVLFGMHLFVGFCPFSEGFAAVSLRSTNYRWVNGSILTIFYSVSFMFFNPLV